MTGSLLRFYVEFDLIPDRLIAHVQRSWQAASIRRSDTERKQEISIHAVI